MDGPMPGRCALVARCSQRRTASLAKRSPELALEQEQLLKREGVAIEDGHVAMAALMSSFDLLAD